MFFLQHHYTHSHEYMTIRMKNFPGNIKNSENGDIADDHYHHYMVIIWYHLPISVTSVLLIVF